jgi:hypothetical protein
LGKVRRGGHQTHAGNPPAAARNPATIGEIMRLGRDPGDAAITTDVVRETLMAQSGFHWLDEESGWFWFEGVRDHGLGNPLLRKIDKILAVAPRVNLAVLRAGLARNWRTMEGFAPPRRVLASLCRQLKDCRLVGGRTVVDTRPRNPATALTRIERAIVAVFRAHGPMLSSADAFRFCGEAGLRKDTITMALWSSPMIRRVAQGVYTLVGARVTPSEIETKAKPAIGHLWNYQSAQDCGWRPDASGLWATYRVSEPMLLSGKLAAPDAFKTYLDSRGYELRDLEGSRIGHVDVSDAHLSGFLPFFRQRRVDLGDHLRVTFDLAKRVALVELSEEAFDDRGSLQQVGA